MKSKQFIAVLLITILTLTLIGCQGSSDRTEEASSDTISGKEIESILADKKAKDNTLIIDVRPTEQYNEGHITNAINMPFDTFKEHISKIMDYKEKEVIVYCNTGNKSGKALDILKEKGFTHAKSGDGVKNYEYAELIMYPNIRGAEFNEIISSNVDVQIIDIRPKDQYAAGHVKNAINMPLDHLKAMSNLNKEKPVIVYCNTGTQSIKAAKLLNEGGFNVSNVIEGVKEFEYELVK